MLEAFSEHINKNFPHLAESKLLIACSGGVDSIVLTHLLYQRKMEFDLAHCNFGLRGAESDSDQAFTEKLGQQLCVKVYVKQFDLSKQSGSIQLIARDLRYEWFHQLIKEHNYDFLLTAHHTDDSMETFLINLSRGTSIEGLTGIPENSNRTLRPLLPFSKEQILNYAKEQGLHWREDSSNAETKYLRNEIRHEIIPKLKKLHPTFLQNFQNTQEHLQNTQLWVENQIKTIKERLFVKEDNRISISAKELNKIQPLESTLYFLFKNYGFTDTKNLKDLLFAISGKQLVSKTHRLVKNREHLLLEEISEKVIEVFEIRKHEFKIEKPIQIHGYAVNAIEKYSVNTIFVDKETLNYPLLIRKWQNGDYFYPFGMEGKKKVAKFFKDEKIDILSKEKQWLLCSGEKIVWVIGRRADDRFKVTSKTKDIIKFTVTE